MSKKITNKIKKFYKFPNSPSRKMIGRLIKEINASESKTLRKGEKWMAKREEAGKRPLTKEQINAHTSSFSRQT